MRILLSFILTINCFFVSSQEVVKGHIDFSDTSEFIIKDFEISFHDTQFMFNDSLEIDTNFHYEFKGFSPYSCGRSFRLEIELTDSLGNTLFHSSRTDPECDPELKKEFCPFFYMNADYERCGITIEDLVEFLSVFGGNNSGSYNRIYSNDKILTIRWTDLKTNFNIK